MINYKAVTSHKGVPTIGIGPRHAHHHGQLDHLPAITSCSWLQIVVLLRYAENYWTVFPPAFKVCPSDQLSSPQIS